MSASSETWKDTCHGNDGNAGGAEPGKALAAFGPGGRHADFMGVCVSWDQRPTVVFGGSPRSLTALLLCLCRPDNGLRTTQNIPASSPLCPHRRNVGKCAFGAWLSLWQVPLSQPLPGLSGTCSSRRTQALVCWAHKMRG